jgi:hypothetical protein
VVVDCESQHEYSNTTHPIVVVLLVTEATVLEIVLDSLNTISSIVGLVYW